MCDEDDVTKTHYEYIDGCIFAQKDDSLPSNFRTPTITKEYSNEHSINKND